jgi:hypothetical protein
VLLVYYNNAMSETNLLFAMPISVVQCLFVLSNVYLCLPLHMCVLQCLCNGRMAANNVDLEGALCLLLTWT